MRILGSVVLAAAGLALGVAPAAAKGGLDVGERAPWPEVRETLNLSAFSTKDLAGKVVLYDIFRTW